MNLPNQIKQSWERVNNRINEFCKNDLENCFKMLFITDVHIGADMAHHIKQYDFVKELIKLNNVDLIVNGGDIGLDVGESNEEALKVIEKTIEHTNFSVPYFVLKGNHDFKSSIISDSELNKKINSYILKCNDKSLCEFINDDDSNGYGYYIHKKSDTRIVFLNTSEEYRKYILKEKQLKYLINQLENMNEKNLIMLSHYCPNKKMAWLGEESNAELEEISILRAILKDFVNKKANCYKQYKWNFTNTRSTLRIYLSGDSHFTRVTDDDGYVITCRQGCGGIAKECLPSGGRVDEFDKNNQVNFDILVINKNNELKLFRVGAGEEINDIFVK